MIFWLPRHLVQCFYIQSNSENLVEQLSHWWIIERHGKCLSYIFWLNAVSSKNLIECIIQSLVIYDAHKNVILYAMKNYRRKRSIRTKGWNNLKRQKCFARTEPGLIFFLKKQITRPQQESWDCLETTYIGYNSFSSSDNSESNLQIQLFNVNVWSSQ